MKLLLVACLVLVVAILETQQAEKKAKPKKSAAPDTDLSADSALEKITDKFRSATRKKLPAMKANGTKKKGTSSTKGAPKKKKEVLKKKKKKGASKNMPSRPHQVEGDIDKSDYNHVYNHEESNSTDWVANYLDIFPFYGYGNSHSRYSGGFRLIGNSFRSFMHAIFKAIKHILHRYGLAFVNRVAVPYFSENIMPIIQDFGMPAVMSFIGPLLADDGKGGGMLNSIMGKISPAG